ncbi:MAG: TonB-dependent receptor [Labilibaculum sp.]|nr:TonB-dependent receptor [Labilibaculum sp.]
MKYILLFFTGIITCLNAHSQASLSGIVKDSNNEALLGASIFLIESNKGTICDIDGKYTIEGLPTGSTKIQFSFTGYDTEIRDVELIKGNNVLDATLPKSTIEVQEIIVTAGMISSQRENTVKVEVLRKENILLSGTPNLMESLSEVPGVEMISMGPGVSKPVIRGRSLTGVLVLKNGVRIENYQYSESHPVGIDDNGVERIEVIKGPASLLYGSDAMGGVVNFVKERPAPVGKIQSDYQSQIFSNTRGINNSLGIKGASQHLFGGVRLSHKNHADYIQGGGGFVPNSRFNEWSLSTNTGYTGKTGTFKLYYDYLKQDIGIINKTVLSLYKSRGRKTDLWYQDLSHHMISSRNKLFLNRFKLETNFAFQSALRKAKRDVVVPFLEMRLNTLTYESKLHFPSGDHSNYIVGVQGLSQWHKNRNKRKTQPLPDADVNSTGIFTLIKYRIFDKVSVQGGFRYDFYNIETDELGKSELGNYHKPESENFNGFNGSVGITTEITSILMLRANIAKAWRAPNLRELTFSGQKGNRYEVGTFNLDPEEAYEGDLSLHIKTDHLSVDIAGFYNHIDDYIYLTPTTEQTSEGLKIYRIAQTNAKMYGGESSIHFHPLSIPWLHIKGTYSKVTGERSSGDYLPLIPADKIRYEVGVEKANWGILKQINFKISALTALDQNKPYVFETATDGYTLVNTSFDTKINLGQQFMTVGFRVNNIFDKKYYDHLSVLKSMNIYNSGRNYSLSLKIPFI